MTGELPSVIDIFQKFNYKQSSGWRNDYAQEKYVSLTSLNSFLNLTLRMNIKFQLFYRKR